MSKTYNCNNCGIRFSANRKANQARHFCSRDCWRESNTGKGHPRWKNGQWVDHQGYIHQWTKDRGYVRAHRLIMEEHLDRQLLNTEHIHHLNFNKQDNRIENLQIIDVSAHTKIHALEFGWSRKFDKCQECHTTETKHMGRGLCKTCYNRWKDKQPQYAKSGQGSINVWQTKYGSCKHCDTTQKPHMAKGLCTTCYNREKEKKRVRKR